MLMRHVENCPVMRRTGDCTCGIRRDRNGLTDFEVNALAIYNGELGHGLAHTPEYDAEMERLQAIFDAYTSCEGGRA